MRRANLAWLFESHGTLLKEPSTQSDERVQLISRVRGHSEVDPRDGFHSPFDHVIVVIVKQLQFVVQIGHVNKDLEASSRTDIRRFTSFGSFVAHSAAVCRSLEDKTSDR